MTRKTTAVYTPTQRHRDRAFIIYGEGCGDFEGERVQPFSLVTVGGATQRLKDSIRLVKGGSITIKQHVAILSPLVVGILTGGSRSLQPASCSCKISAASAAYCSQVNHYSHCQFHRQHY